MLYSEKLQAIAAKEQVHLSLEDCERILLMTARNYPSTNNDNILALSIGVARLEKTANDALQQPQLETPQS